MATGIISIFFRVFISNYLLQEEIYILYANLPVEYRISAQYPESCTLSHGVVCWQVNCFATAVKHRCLVAQELFQRFPVNKNDEINFTVITMETVFNILKMNSLLAMFSDLFNPAVTAIT